MRGWQIWPPRVGVATETAKNPQSILEAEKSLNCGISHSEMKRFNRVNARGCRGGQNGHLATLCGHNHGGPR